MTARLILTPPFAVDLKNQVDWLFKEGHDSWVEQLREELEDAYALLQEFPEAGARTEHSARKLRLT